MSKKELTDEEIFNILDQKENEKSKDTEHCGECFDSMYEEFNKELQKIEDGSDLKKAGEIAETFAEIIKKEDINVATFSDVVAALFPGFFLNNEYVEDVLAYYLSYVAVKAKMIVDRDSDKFDKTTEDK